MAAEGYPLIMMISISCGPRASQASQYYLCPHHLLKDRNGERREAAEAQQYLSSAEV